MKRCPTCQSTYTDDSLRFCLQDGTALINVGRTTDAGPTIPDQEKTLLINSAGRGGPEPPPTEILPHEVMPTLLAPPQRSPVTTPQPPRPTAAGPYDAATAQRPKNNALVIPITIAVTVLVLAVVGIGAWLLFGNKGNSGTGNSSAGRTTERTTTTTASPAATPTAAASPTPTASPVNMAVLRKEVMETLNGWAESSMARDLDAQMSYYADTLDIYYTKTNVSASVVRGDRERAYDTYSTLDIELSNVQITPDTTGLLANALLDKTWNFEGEDKASSGSVQQEIRLAKRNGRWRIIGEKDVQVYYVNK
jgi:ketosteroid isomerase-like protein